VLTVASEYRDVPTIVYGSLALIAKFIFGESSSECVNTWPAPSAVVVVNQVIVNKCPRMKELHACCRGQSRFRVASHGTARPQQHCRPQAFAGTFQISIRGRSEMSRAKPCSISRLGEV